MSDLQRAQLVRTHDNGALFISGLVGTPKQQLRDARQRIAWCGTDNLSMTRAEASAAANAFDGTAPHRVGHFTFELVTR